MHKYRRYKLFRCNSKKTRYRIIYNIVFTGVIWSFLICFDIIKGSIRLTKDVAKYMFNFKKVYKKFKDIGYDFDKLENVLQSMNGRQFEIFCEQLFKCLGYKTRLTPQTNDYGKDIILEKDGETTYVECKRWKSDLRIGRPQIQKLIGATIVDKADKMIFITTCKFNMNVQAYVENVYNLELWDMDTIITKLIDLDKNDLLKIFTRVFNHDDKIIRIN